ncbi:type II toxin-antitoxin system HicA family toxin [Geminocystis sp. GBBB08]|uniref:type II toxin-antitoxin system HicA family toxin n=1 Tax=Geminocystis sp. GBBB08 TaxID=2604140 RepID=UPI0027E21968|nr:type II toxin-antitoxin system HicA family toxin [Geminocystis sp. GBBB08]MBL1210664.1 type II toxin-antitoxin system HicA family toxin [Geminocystis sp. GBBB08]
MPKKVRELKKMLIQAGFKQVPGKGSHTNWVHPYYQGKITVSGNDSADAKIYQEKLIKQAILEVKKEEK